MFVSVLIVRFNTTNMSINEKSSKPNDLCKGHTARGGKDFYRLCPSKLNKRELEDLYYSLLDKNLELKREMNIKNERIRTLNTKVQRMTACTKPYLSSGKDCCAGAKALITEQKQSIADLKKTNDAMAERIKRLNVKLCTAKQFLKQSPQNYKGFKYNMTVPSNSCRNLSSGLANKTSTDNMRSTAVSARSLASDHPERKSVETNTEAVHEDIKPEKLEKEHVCPEIQCRSAVEEFQNRILDLKKELSKTHAEYSSRMGHLERKVSQLQSARLQEPYLRHKRDAAVERDLSTQVSFEKNKLADLEMRLKSASMSEEVANTIAEHLKNANKLEERRVAQMEKMRDCCNPCGTTSPNPCGLSPVRVPPLSAPGELAPDAPYRSDDSGYADTRRDSDHDGFQKIENRNGELVKRIADLQAQLDAIKMSAHDHLQPTREPVQKAAKRISYDVIVDELDVPVVKNFKDYNCFIIDPDKKVIIEVEHVNKDGSFEIIDRELEPNKDVSEVPEPLQCKRRLYIKPESPECSRKLSETNFQQYDTINEQKRGIQDAYDGLGKSNLPLDLRIDEERFNVRLGEPVCEVSKPVEEIANEIVQPNDPPQVQIQNGKKDYLVPKSQPNDPPQVQMQNGKKDYLVPKSQPNDPPQVQMQNGKKDYFVPKSQPNDPPLVQMQNGKKDYLVPKSQPNDPPQVQMQNGKKDYLVPKSQPNDPPQVQMQNDKKDYLVPKWQPNEPPQNDVKDNSVLPKKQVDKRKKDSNVICKCPNEEEEPLKDNEPVDAEEKNKDGKNNRWRNVYCSIDDINTAEKPMQNATPPMKNAISPMQNATTPMQNAISPMHNATSSMQNTTTPMHNATTPMQNAISLIQNATSPMQNATPKSDNHNGVQIPGPCPVNSSRRESSVNKVNQSSMKGKFLACSKDKYDTHEGNAPECRETCLTQRESAMTDTNKGDVNATNMKSVDNTGIAGPHVVFGKQNEIQSKESFQHKYFNYDTSQTDDMKNVYKLPEAQTSNRENTIELNDVQNEKATDTKTEIVKCINQNCNERRVNDKIEPRLVGGRRPPVCLCTDKPEPLPVCGGATHENKPNSEIVRCLCDYDIDCGGKHDSNQCPLSMRTRQRRMTVVDNSATFTVLSPQEKRSRATSPDNTDYEISHLSDLPTEKDGTSTRVLSPGEHKATSTSYTDSFTPYNDTSLSEGEVPNRYQKRNISISVGECTDVEPAKNDYNQSSADKMEAALQAISQELARCRALLETQRSREQQSSFKDVATAAEPLQKESIALRRSQGRSCMSGTNVPKCIFALHIGTIVLSDEAVLNTRTTPLMLTWKFFGQNVVMTRMSSGRVAHFDFSTQYVIKITDEFIQHLKYEEMPLTICIIDESQTPYASCSLPLREALLNANHRVDLSLALVAHSNLNRKTEELESSDVGVLDLWCMLRADSDDLAVIRRAFDLTKKLKPGRPSQNDNDDLYHDFRNSLDADLFSRINNRRMTTETDPIALQSDVEKSGVNNDNHVPEPKSTCVPNSSVGAYSGIKRRGSMYNEKNASVTSDLGMNNFEVKKELGPDFQRSPFRESIMYRNAAKGKIGRSGIILTEVTPKIRSPEEMKNIWEINSLINSEDVPNMDRRLTNIDRSRRVTPPVQVALKESPNDEPDANNKSGDNNPLLLDPDRKVSNALNRPDVTKNPVITQPAIYSPNPLDNKLEITILWLTLNENCEAMRDSNVRRLYLAYSFLGRDGAELETPVSLPKPSQYGEKCFFNFKKTFYLTEFDMPILDHMAKCRSQNRHTHNSKDCIVFWVVSEPPEDPLGLDNCEDIGYAYLYLGDELAYSMEDSFTEVLPVSTVKGEDVIGVVAVRLDGLDGLRARVGRSQ